MSKYEAALGDLGNELESALTIVANKQGQSQGDQSAALMAAANRVAVKASTLQSLAAPTKEAAASTKALQDEVAKGQRDAEKKIDDIRKKG